MSANSLATYLAVNSGPLIFRTYNGSFPLNNTYWLGPNDTPVSSNRVLITGANGLVSPTDQPTLSSITGSSIVTSYASVYSVLTTSTLSTNQVSSVYVSGSTMTTTNLSVSNPFGYKGDVVALPSANHSLDATHYGKYLFVTYTSGNTNVTLPTMGLTGADGQWMMITNTAAGNTTTIYNVLGGSPRTLTQNQSLWVMYYNTQWRPLANV